MVDLQKQYEDEEGTRLKNGDDWKDYAYWLEDKLEQSLKSGHVETLVMWRSVKKQLPKEDELVVTVSRSKCVRLHRYSSKKKYNAEKQWEAEPFPDWITHWGRLDEIPKAT